MAQFNHQKTYLPQVRRSYSRIGQIIQSIIARHVTSDGRIDDLQRLNDDLSAYGVNLRQWANDFWGQLLERQQKALTKDWKKNGLDIDPRSPRVQAAIARAKAEQVELITTLPRKAAEQAQLMAQKAALSTGERAETLKAKLQGLEPGYPEYAARRLARSEIASTQSLLVTAQALDAGSEAYVWRTVGDADVRESHKRLDGKIFRFDDMSDKDGDGCVMPGGIYNCRCYAEPLFTKLIK